ncbi:MAG: DUF4328 domain-containing protein [Pirellulales bacterium]
MSNDFNPYQSPQSGSPGLPPPSVGGIPRGKRYASGATRAYIVMVLTGLTLFANLLAAGSGFMQLQLLQRAQAGAAISEEEANVNDTREVAIGVFQIILQIALIVVLLMWFHRVHSNLPALGAAGLQYTPGWAVGAWFVPILNLFRPIQIAGEIWRASDPENIRHSDPRYWKNQPGSALLVLWWSGWIISNIVSNVSARAAIGAETVPQLINVTGLSIFAALLDVWPAICLLQVVREINRRQETLHQSLCDAVAAGSSSPGFRPPEPPRDWSHLDNG